MQTRNFQPGHARLASETLSANQAAQGFWLGLGKERMQMRFDARVGRFRRFRRFRVHLGCPFRAECRLGTSNLNTPDLCPKLSQPIRRRRASGSALGRSARKCVSMRAGRFRRFRRFRVHLGCPFRAECRLGTSNLNTPDLRLKLSQPIRRRRASGSALGRSVCRCASMRARETSGVSAYI